MMLIHNCLCSYDIFLDTAMYTIVNYIAILHNVLFAISRYMFHFKVLKEQVLYMNRAISLYSTTKFSVLS